MKRIFEEALNLVYPDDIYCICCGDLMKDRVHGLCDKCISTITWLSENPLQKEGFSFDDVVSVASYDYYTKHIIYDLKFHQKSYVAKNIGRLMGEVFKESHGNDYLMVPVPMYRKKEKERGYNQAELLARYASLASGNEFLPDALIKTKDTKSVRSASGDKRIFVLDGSIEINPKRVELIRNANIALVDDVVTTGSTAQHCSIVLKKAGAKSIVVLSFAAVQYRSIIE